MKKVTLYQRLRYEFDNLMSKGTFAPILLLLVAAGVSIFVLAFFVYITGAIPKDQSIQGLQNIHNIGYFETIWVTILRTLDGGVVAYDPLNTLFVFFMFIATLGGLFMLSTLIGIVNSGVVRKISDLRKGKSFVVEKNHTVVLGWSFQVFQIVSELVIANENQKNPSIAILAEKDKVEMEDEIKSKVGTTQNTKLICRTGNPIDLQDLEIINLNEAKAIIILAPETGDPDSIVIKTILAITNNPHRKPAPHKYHIVAEVRDPRNVRIAEIAGKNEVQLVVFDYLISRITAQTCRQPGLSVVFTELLDFKGDEIYFQEESKIVGKTFVEAMFAYETSAIIGLRRHDGRIMIKPPMTTKIERGDMVIAISEDDDTVILSGMTEFGIDPGAIRIAPKYVPPKPEATLILGWNRRAPLILNELDNYVWPGSKITVVADSMAVEKELATHCSGLTHQTVTFWLGDTTNRRILDDLQIEQYDHIIVLSQTELTDVQSTDAKTLSTLLHLRDIADLKGHTFSIVSEMLDDRNRQLAEITYTDDFIVSVKLDSLMLSQISENKELKTVFEDLFSAGGPAIYIKPAEFYVELGRPVNFYTVMESARQRNQIAIGYKLHQPRKQADGKSLLAYGVVVNPKKSNQMFFSEGDKIIIISDEEQLG
ncbi:MAG: potassium transporter TrkA [Bacteroidetes bacterium]|nr:MAG: potassium transporter TrkA [Bacteroidota bacterium]